MSIVNTSRPTTSIANTARVSFGETWATITTTWASETRDWQETGSLFDNVSISSDTIWSSRTFPWVLALPWQQVGGMTNTSKP